MGLRRQATVSRTKSSARVAKPKSKRRAADRSQNAFDLADDASADESVLLGDKDYSFKAEYDEEIESDGAFESGDEDKFTSFSFAGSRIKTSRKPRKNESDTANSPRRLSIDLDEQSKPMEQQKSGFETKRQASLEQDSEISASDFESDAGEDLMDLSEMLKTTQSEQVQTTTNNASESKVSSVGDRVTRGEAPDAGNNNSHFAALSTANRSDVSTISSEDESEDTDRLSDDSSSSSDEHEDRDTVSALERFVSKLDTKRKESDSAKISKRNHKKQRLSLSNLNESVNESEYNVPTMGKKLQLEDLIGHVGDSNAKALRKAVPLSAPLAKPLRDRMDRAAAYDTVKEQVSKWQPAVKQIRESSVLKFPMNDSAKTNPNNNALASSFNPTNQMEQEIQKILRSSGLQSEKQVSAFEDLEMAKMSVEDVQKRRAELAIMRDLMFRQERKAKRQNKIKSKAYRKIQRKEREKLKAELGEEDLDTEEVSRRSEERRARERMELRHKNTGRWAQKMIDRADHGEGSRSAITEQLKRGEDLERKVRGTDHDPDLSDDSEFSSTSQRNSMPMQPLPQTGVFGMKFMRDADALEAAALQASTETESETTSAVASQSLNGRRVFHPVPGQTSVGRKNVTPDLVTNKPTGKHKKIIDDGPVGNASSAPVFVSGVDEVSEIENPWLSKPIRSKQAHDTVLSKDSEDSLKFAKKLAKRQKTTNAHLGCMNAVKFNSAQILTLRNVGDAEYEANPVAVSRENASLQQADLVARAFAGDDVVAEFAAVKESINKEDAPKEIDETLPGWGSWIGDGVKSRPKTKKFTRQVEGIQEKKRKDAKLEHVIINEKRMKQAKTYLSQSVPFPFETKEQYERSLNLPIGPEWTTRTSFQQQITPHVIRKQGSVIAPMARPFRE